MNPILEGWKCPSCFLVHAPFVKSCDCMVVRAREPAGPLTMSEAIKRNEVMDAWQKAREAERTELSDLVGGDQWGGRDRPFNECRPVRVEAMEARAREDWGNHS